MSIPRTTILGDHEVKRIGLGTNRLTDTQENRDFLRQAVDAGVDLIDTAHLYTGSESERTVGAALAPFRDGLVVASKAGYNLGAAGRSGCGPRSRTASSGSGPTPSPFTTSIVSTFDSSVEALFAGWLRVGRLDATYGAVLGALPYVSLALVLAVGGRPSSTARSRSASS